MLPRMNYTKRCCSLNEGENRLALSCIMTVNPKGEVIDHEIAETVIKVDRRMSYTSVAKILEEHDENEIAKYEELVPMFELMKELSHILREHRRKRGSIDFDFPESKMVLDEMVDQLILSHMTEMWLQRLLKILCCLRMKPLRKNISGESFRFYIERMISRMKIK